MRINIYKEELTDRVEMFTKMVEGRNLWALRLYMYLPVSVAGGATVRGPFEHGPDDDDSAAITFWFADQASMLSYTQMILDMVKGGV